MANPNFRSSVWGMEHGLTLEGIRELQTNIDYSEPIEYLEEIDNLTAFEKTLLHNWDITSDILTYKPRGSETEFRYYTSIGNFESAASENNAFADPEHTVLLPRDRRVFQRSAAVIFIEMNGRVYSIVYGGASAFQVRTILMGRGLKSRRREVWGKIDETLPQYTYGSDFFYWMYQKYGIGGTVQTDYGNVVIRDIEGIGRFSDRRQHNTRGRGPQSTGEISNKTALGIDQLVYESDFILDFPNMNLSVCIDEHATCIIDKKRSVYIDDAQQVLSVVGVEKEILLALYLEILPGLLGTYHREQVNSQWTPTLATNAKRSWALEVIEELCMHHGITKKDLNQLPFIP